jgi:hypothetical protein
MIKLLSQAGTNTHMHTRADTFHLRLSSPIPLFPVPPGLSIFVTLSSPQAPVTSMSPRRTP